MQSNRGNKHKSITIDLHLQTDTPLTVGQIVSGGAAADDGRLKEGDEIVEIDGRRVEVR